MLQTIKLNIKWLLIRQNRPFNTDDLSAFVSWFVWSNLIWLVVGTTTFASLLFLTMKQLDWSGSLWMDKLFLHAVLKVEPTKVNIDMKSIQGENVIPNFHKGVITLRNVTISNAGSDPAFQFGLDVDQMDITLDFKKWYHGRGLINDVNVDGIRGFIKNNINDEDVAPGDKEYLVKLLIPLLFHGNQQYEFGNIRLQNACIDYSLRDQDPVDFEIFNLELPKLRVRWFLLDVLRPKICSGAINDALFTVHQKQIRFGKEENPQSTITRLQIHELDVKNNPFFAQKFNWITDGKANVVCDINLPSEKHTGVTDLIAQVGHNVNKDLLMGVDLDNLHKMAMSLAQDHEISEKFFKYSNLFDSDLGGLGKYVPHASKLEVSPHAYMPEPDNRNRYLLFDLKVQFMNAVAKVPESVPSATYTKKPFISEEHLKPIIALVNNKPASNSFFLNNRTFSILLPSEVTTLDHVSHPNKVHEEWTQLQDKQFTLTGSAIFNLDNVYQKVSLLRETDLVDQLVGDLYEDMVRNLHYELNSRFFARYGQYYNFNVRQLLDALGKNSVVGGDGLFGINNHSASHKLGLLFLLGIGAFF